VPRFPLLCAVLSFAFLSSCGGGADDGKVGTDVSTDAKSEEGSTVAISADSETGKVSFKVPGIDANVTLPKTMMDETRFDIDGVKLYPGSKVSKVNVNADETGLGSEANVKIGFNAPAGTEKVRAWFAKGFAEKGIKATPTPTGFTGVTADGDAFTLSLVATAQGTTDGEVNLIDRTKD
jgi:hypothetical protein